MLLAKLKLQSSFDFLLSMKEKLLVLVVRNTDIQKWWLLTELFVEVYLEVTLHLCIHIEAVKHKEYCFSCCLQLTGLLYQSLLEIRQQIWSNSYHAHSANVLCFNTADPTQEAVIFEATWSDMIRCIHQVQQSNTDRSSQIPNYCICIVFQKFHFK